VTETEIWHWHLKSLWSRIVQNGIQNVLLRYICSSTPLKMKTDQIWGPEPFKFKETWDYLSRRKTIL
jgi:hypothetical protein